MSFCLSPSPFISYLKIFYLSSINKDDPVWSVFFIDAFTQLKLVFFFTARPKVNSIPCGTGTDKGEGIIPNKWINWFNFLKAHENKPNPNPYIFSQPALYKLVWICFDMMSQLQIKSS